jgi:hypothetical protein
MQRRTPILAAMFCGLFLFNNGVVAAGGIETFPNSPLTVTDVSPEAAFGGTPDGGFDPSGRVDSIAIDRFNDNILYATTNWAGVWKSTDGARTWSQASAGLRTGVTPNERSLAIDDVHPNRLMYLTKSDDGRPTSYGGLYVSIDSANSWSHISPTACATDKGSLIFSRGQPFFATACGIFTSSDPNLINWHVLQTTPSAVNAAINNGATVYFAGTPTGTFFACVGSSVYKVDNSGAIWSNSPVNAGGSCYGLAAAPLTELQASTVLVIRSIAGGGYEVTVIDFDCSAGTQGCSRTQDLNFSNFWGQQGSGVAAVATALRDSALQFERRPGFKYDVYAADGCSWFAYNPITNGWQKLQGGDNDRAHCTVSSSYIHADTWSMVFPSSYDPARGACRAYAATDGGVFANLSGVIAQPFGGCVSGWTQAESGLHIMHSGTMAGISRPQVLCLLFLHVQSPCPVLYLPTGDDGTWVSNNGGSTWQHFSDHLGDAGQAFVDPALPTRVLTQRNGGSGNYELAYSTDGDPPYSNNFANLNIYEPNLFSAFQPPNASGIAQVMTLASETPNPEPIYISLQQSPSVSSPGCVSVTYPPQSCNDRLVLISEMAPTWWNEMGGSEYFPPFGLSEVAVSGGIAHPTIYVLTTNSASPSHPNKYPTLIPGPGQVWKTLVFGALPWHVLAFAPAFNGLVMAVSIFVNPYDPNELYATDLGDNTIKVSRDGGAHWVRSDLTSIATNEGEFRIGCGFPQSETTGFVFFGGTCSLSGMSFDRRDPSIRVAATYPGGLALSRDGGAHWIALNVTHNVSYTTALLPNGRSILLRVWRPVEIPQSVFYDDQVGIGTPSIYMALDGNSIKRVDGPFSSLQALNFSICAPCLGISAFDLARRSRRDPIHVSAVFSNIQAVVPLSVGDDGLYHGSLLFDSSKLSALTYHLEVDGNSTPQLYYKLSDAVRKTGVALLNNKTIALRSETQRIAMRRKP